MRQFLQLCQLELQLQPLSSANEPRCG